MKDTLITPETLAHYDLNRPAVIAADASSTEIGAVLLQVQDNYNGIVQFAKHRDHE